MAEVNYEYVNQSTLVFEGFYNTLLSGDMELEDITYNDIQEGIISENQEYDFLDYKKYKEEVGKKAVLLLSCICADSVIHNFKLTQVYSPTYYNYSTDQLGISMMVDTSYLEKFCFYDNSNRFNKYLNKFWSSCDGFASFTPNNIVEFHEKYKEDTNKYLNIMIEYYILCKLNKTNDCDLFTDNNDYTSELHNSISNIVWNYIEVIDKQLC